MYKTYFARSGIFLEKYKNLNIESAILDEEQLKKHLEKIAMKYNIQNKSDKNTYPVPQMSENYAIIKAVYNLSKFLVCSLLFANLTTLSSNS